MFNANYAFLLCNSHQNIGFSGQEFKGLNHFTMDFGEGEQDGIGSEKGLSEDVIKRVALPFLKGHYKFRSDLMESDLEAGNLLESLYDSNFGGYIVDGYIAFRQRTGDKFIATFEATSADKKEELYYTILSALIIWDGLALSSILLTCLFTMSYGFKWFDFKQAGLFLLIVAALFLLTLLTLVFNFIFSFLYKGVDRYHYIYAVEQFKRYKANEKWIVFGEDVFPTPDDPHFVELRDQCTKGGYGLVKVSKDLRTTKILTPARTNFMEGKRVLDLVTQNEFTRNIPKTPFLLRLKRDIRKTIKKIERRVRFLKFRRSYLPQMGIVALGFALTSIVFWKEFKNPEIVYETDDTYEAKLLEREFVAKNDKDTVLDSLDQQFVQTIDTSVENYLNLPLEERPNYILKQRKSNRVAFDDFAPRPTNTDIPPTNYGIYLLTEGKVMTRLSCQRIAGNKLQYLVQESIHADSSTAFQRVNTLFQRDVAANVFWTGCTSVQRDSYAVFLDMFFDTLYVAQIQVNVSKRLLESKGLISNVKLRPIKILQ